MSLAVDRFVDLFRGRWDAIGLDRGGVERREVTRDDYERHWRGEVAMGVFPMMPGNAVWFGAIDLDEPNFELAERMRALLPTPSWLERSRSGNAHVWVFFRHPQQAWVVRTVLRAATVAAGRPDVEIFPKQDALKPGMVGNYINLPCFGDERPILQEWEEPMTGYSALNRGSFVLAADENRQDPELWERIARAHGAVPPQDRRDATEWGTRPRPHDCAAWIIEGRHERPLAQGHRHVVLFNLAKMLLNTTMFDLTEARRYVDQVNEAGARPLPPNEIERLFENARRGQWTSTGCDDPVMQPYVRPDCPIANLDR
jgi:hypothetical protein